MIAEYWSGVEREIYLAEASKRLELPIDVLKNSVEQTRRKQKRAHAQQESREAQASVKNFGDRINPDAAKSPRAASAEESVLGLLLLYEEYRTFVEKGEIPLTESAFVTEFHRRVFATVMQRHRDEGGLHPELLGMDFSPDEMGRIQKMIVARQQLSDNGVQVFRSAVATLQDAREQQEADGLSLNDRIAYLRKKKGNIHKGKAEQV